LPSRTQAVLLFPCGNERLNRSPFRFLHYVHRIRKWKYKGVNRSLLKFRFRKVNSKTACLISGVVFVGRPWIWSNRVSDNRASRTARIRSRERWVTVEIFLMLSIGRRKAVHWSSSWACIEGHK
jgi:hypothetical protein